MASKNIRILPLTDVEVEALRFMCRVMRDSLAEHIDHGQEFMSLSLMIMVETIDRIAKKLEIQGGIKSEITKQRK